jgi:hypothetical protein
MPICNDVYVTLEIGDPNSRRTCRVTAVHEGNPIHVDDFNPANAQRRRSFLRRVEEVAERQTLRCNAAELEAALVQHLRDEIFDLTEENRSRRDDIEPSQVLAALDLTVLGENDDLSVQVWSSATKKYSRIKSTANLEQAEILQIIGDEASDRLWAGPPDDQPDNTFTVGQIQRAIALTAANAPRVSSVERVGQGAWPHGDSVLIVNGADAALYNCQHLEHLQHPLFEHRLMKLDAAKQWHPSLPETLNRVAPEQNRQLLERLTELIARWNWTHAWDARVLAALMIATFVQGVWRWRPLVSITGPSDCGKSTFFQELLLAVFLDWAVCTDRSTEAGLRQRIRDDAMPVLLDEFDVYHQRQQVLELFRTASRGGVVLRGTADQTGQQFNLCHIPWIAAIETGDVWGQDRNRFLKFELQPPASRGLELPNETELHELGHNLAAAAIWSVRSAAQLANSIKRTAIDGVHGRLIESFSVPAAMYAVMSVGRDASEVQAEEILRAMIAGRNSLQDQGEPDEIRLLRDILGTNVRVTIRENGENRSGDQSVAQLLQKSCCHRSDLEAKGLRLLQNRSDALELFLVPEQISRYLLSGTRWQQSRIDQILLRIPGAHRVQQRLGHDRPRGIALPWPGCLGCHEPQDAE